MDEGFRAATKKSEDPRESAFAALDQVRAKASVRRATELEAALERIRAARPWVKGETRADAIRGDDLWTLWAETYSEAFSYAGQPVHWSKRERGMAADLFRRWTVKPDGSKPNGEFDDFVVFCISNWGEITAKEFAWMKERAAPEHPTLTFLIRFLDKFENAFLNRTRKKLLSRMDIDEVEELRLKGYSHDAALEVIARRKVAATRRTSAPAAPKALPLARVRQRPQGLQPVATEKGLPVEEETPTRLASAVSAKTPEQWEAELWGTP
jgi:hypothetical protein